MVFQSPRTFPRKHLTQFSLLVVFIHAIKKNKYTPAPVNTLELRNKQTIKLRSPIHDRARKERKTVAQLFTDEQMFGKVHRINICCRN